MGRVERAKNLAEAERQRRHADKKESRFRRRLEDRFIEQTAAKVGGEQRAGTRALRGSGLGLLVFDKEGRCLRDDRDPCTGFAFAD